jgi:hypothetical protein
MRHLSWAVACALISAGAVAACGLSADVPKERVTTKQVKERMTAVHKGDQSPFARTGKELKKETPDWDQLGKDAKAFAGMGDLLGRHSAYTSPAAYVANAADLTKAAKAKDRKAAAAAFGGLTKSCGACHYGNPLR